MSAYSDLILAHTSLRAYFRLGEASGTTLDDVGPNNLDGTYAASGVTYAVAGAIRDDANTAVTFAGSSDAASTADNNALDLGDGPFSIELWFKRSATQGTNQGLIAKLGTGGYLIRFNTSNVIEAQKIGTGSFATSGTGITDTASWHHLVVTKNGSARTIYIDGVDRTSLVTNQTLGDTTGALAIGYQTAGTNRYTGSLDEIAIYGAVLSPTEILQHFNAGRALLPPAASATASAPAPTPSVAIAPPASAGTAAASAPTPTVSVTAPTAAATAASTAPTPAVTVTAVAAAATANGIAPTPSVSTTSPAGQATAEASAPTPVVGVTGVAVAATADGLAPTVGEAIMAAPASATADGIAPTPVVTVTAPAASATADGSAPSVGNQHVVNAVPAEATANASAPGVTIALSPPAASATGETTAPVPAVGATSPAGEATASASAPTPTVAVTAPPASASASASPPTLDIETDITVTAPPCEATASMPAPTVGEPVAEGLGQLGGLASAHLGPLDDERHYDVELRTRAATATATGGVAHVEISVSVPAAWAQSRGLAPSVSVSVSSPAASATARAQAPGLGASVTVPAATARAQGGGPEITATWEVSIHPAAGRANATTGLPVVRRRNGLSDEEALLLLLA